MTGFQGTNTVAIPYTPPDQQGRVGDSQIIHQEIFDTPLMGYGETLDATEDIFSNPRRIGNRNRTNLRKAGELSNNKQFEICCMYTSFYITQTADAPEGAASASLCFDYLMYFTRQTLFLQETSKGGPFLTHRIGGGGGAWAGANENAGAFEKTNGLPASDNVFVLSDPFVLPPLHDFKLILEWAGSLPNIGGANNFTPLTEFNANTTALKRLVFGLIGYEVRNVTNA